MTDTTQVVAADAAPVTQQEPVAPAQETTAPADLPATEQESLGDSATPHEDESGLDPAAESQPKKKGGFQKKIDQLTREKYEALLRAEKAEQLAAEFTRKQTQPTQYTSEPTLEQFNTVDEFVAAHRDWAKQEGRKLAEQEAQQRSEEQKFIATKASLQAREEVARGRYQDFDQVIDPIAPIFMNNPVLQQYVLESDASLDVGYHLAKNPAKLAAILDLPPLGQMRELFAIEARLKAAPPPKPITKAPDPIKPVGARETTAKTLGDLAAADDVSAYIARANKAGR